MPETGGSKILIISSNSGKFGQVGLSAYCAAKHGLMGLADSLSQELRETETSVHVICPGRVLTDMARSGHPYPDTSLWLDVDDIVNAAMYLLTLPPKNHRAGDIHSPALSDRAPVATNASCNGCRLRSSIPASHRGRNRRMHDARHTLGRPGACPTLCRSGRARTPVSWSALHRVRRRPGNAGQSAGAPPWRFRSSGSTSCAMRSKTGNCSSRIG